MDEFINTAPKQKLHGRGGYRIQYKITICALPVSEQRDKKIVYFDVDCLEHVQKCVFTMFKSQKRDRTEGRKREIWE